MQKKIPDKSIQSITIDHSIKNVWKAEYKIRNNEIDMLGKLAVPSLCDLMQEAAIEHSESFGLSMYDLLTERNLTWVLSRLILKIDSYPRRKDLLKIQTWPSAIKKHFVYRDFHLMNSNNQTIGYAVTVWPIIDVKTRRPVSAGPFAHKLNVNNTEDPPVLDFTKLPKLEKYDYKQQIRIRYRDLDMNRHVNYVSYIEWIINSVPPALPVSHQINELEINYLAEINFGDTIISKCRAVPDRDNEFLHSICNSNDGRELARAKTVWKQKSK